MRLTLHSFGSWIPQSSLVSELAGADPRAARTLMEAGFEHYMESPTDVAAMLGAAAAASLAASELDRSEVEHVIVVTESLWDRAAEAPQERRPHLTLRDAVLQAVDRLGLTNAQVHGSWMSGCGNLAPALALAQGLAGLGEGQILLVCADRLHPSASRVLAGNQAIFSDIGAACLIGERPHGLRLKHVVLHTSVEILKAQRAGNFLAVALELRAGLIQLDAKVRTLTGSGIAETGPVIVENLNPMLVRACCQTLGISPERVSSPTLGQLGHAFSADLLLSLERTMSIEPPAPGTMLVALSISSWSLAASVFQIA